MKFPTPPNDENDNGLGIVMNDELCDNDETMVQVNVIQLRKSLKRNQTCAVFKPSHTKKEKKKEKEKG